MEQIALVFSNKLKAFLTWIRGHFSQRSRIWAIPAIIIASLGIFFEIGRSDLVFTPSGLTFAVLKF